MKTLVQYNLHFWANFTLSLSQICLYLPSFRREIISKITSFYMYINFSHLLSNFLLFIIIFSYL